MTQSDTQQTQELVIERVVDAPLERVWEAWTDPEQMKKWWGPKEFTAPTVEIDLKEGGKYLNCMRSPDGQDFWSTGVYREIVPMEKLVLTDSFADERGNVGPGAHYGMADVPLETEVTVTFEDQDGKTKLTLRHAGMPVGEHGSQAEGGWNESLDKLAASLA